jgi:hypothetical protein
VLGYRTPPTGAIGFWDRGLRVSLHFRPGAVDGAGQTIVSGTEPIAEVALAREEPLAGHIRSALGPRFRAVDAGAGVRPALRIFGPAELMRSGPRALERHRRRHPTLPFVVVLPPGAAAAFVRACLEAGAAEVVQSDQLELRLAPALEAAQRTRR